MAYTRILGHGLSKTIRIGQGSQALNPHRRALEHEIFACAKPFQLRSGPLGTDKNIVSGRFLKDPVSYGFMGFSIRTYNKEVLGLLVRRKVFTTQEYMRQFTRPSEVRTSTSCNTEAQNGRKRSLKVVSSQQLSKSQMGFCPFAISTRVGLTPSTALEDKSLQLW